MSPPIMIAEAERNGHEGTQSKPVELKLQSKINKWSRRLLDFGFAFMGCDPFAIYAQDHLDKRAAAVPLGRQGWRREKWAIFSIIFNAYLAVKSLAALTLRCMLVIMTTGSASVSSKRLFELLNWTLKVVGDPFSSLSSVRLAVYLIGPMWCLAACSVLPYHLNYNRPLDCPFARILLEPEQERQKYDLDMNKFLSHIIDIIEKQRLEITDFVWLSRISQANNENSLVRLGRAKLQLKELKFLKFHRLQVLRPKTLQPKWHERSCASFFKSASTYLAIQYVFGFAVSLTYSHQAWQTRCEALKATHSTLDNQTTSSTDCSVLRAFSASELLFIFELVIQLAVFANTTYAFYVLINLFQVRTQLNLTESVHQELAQVLDKLRTFNQKIRGSPKLDEPLARADLDLSLSKALVSLWMFKKESKANVSCPSYIISLLVSAELVVTLISFTIFNSSATWAKILLSGSNLATDSSGSSSAALLSNWILGIVYMNCFMFYGASIPARANKIKRSIFSIFAELTRLRAASDSQRLSGDLDQRQQVRRVFRLAFEDPILALWHRFLHSGILNDHQPSIRMLSIRLTYSSILQVNFNVITIISLLCLTMRGS